MFCQNQHPETDRGFPSTDRLKQWFPMIWTELADCANLTKIVMKQGRQCLHERKMLERFRSQCSRFTVLSSGFWVQGLEKKEIQKMIELNLKKNTTVTD